MRHASSLLAVACVLFSMSGCIAVGGHSDTTPPTLGKELTDLKTAFDHGALTQQEYEQAKAQLIVNAPSKTARR